MMAKRLLAGVLCVMLTAQAFSTISHAATVKGEGSASTETDFDSTGLFNNDLIVMIPDEVPLTLNEESGRLEGKGFVTAWGNAGARTQLSVSTDRDITYVLEDDNNITVDADVSFGDTENNTAVWDSAVLRDNIEASQKTGEYVFASVPLSAIDNIGTYRSDILFNIFMDSRAGSGGSGDSVQDVELFSYEETNYDGMEGYSLMGFSPEGLSYIKNCEDESITLQFPDTYNGKPVLEWSGYNEELYPDLYNINVSDIKIVLGSNFKRIQRPFGDDNHIYVPTNNFGEHVSSIECNEGLQEISEKAFYMGGLNSIILPDTITSIEKKAFYRCNNLERVTFADGFSGTIGEEAFYKTAITDLTIPALTKSIGKDAFRECSNLESIIFEEGFSGEIGESAFYKTAITDLTIPASIKSTGSSAFSCCSNLESIIFEEGFSGEIGDSAFSSTAITNLTIPALTKSIGSGAFYNCSNLERVTFAEGFSGEIGDSAFCYTAITDLTIPALTKSVGNYAFCNCSNLERVTFVDGFNGTLGCQAFRSSAIKELSFPSSLMSGKTNLSEALSMDDYCGIRKYIFDNNADDFNIDNPARCVHYSFNDKDFLCDELGIVEIPKGLINEDYTVEFKSNEMLNSNGRSSLRNLCLMYYINKSKNYKFNGYVENCDYIILKEGITDIGVSLSGTKVTIPSTLETISYKDALNNCTIVGTADFRNVSGMSAMNFASADKCIVNSTMLAYAGSKTDSTIYSPKIKELYICYDGIPSNTHAMSISKVEAIYFSGTEEEWEAVSGKLKGLSSFTGEIHYNASF